jgi:hypothetical protein
MYIFVNGSLLLGNTSHMHPPILVKIRKWLEKLCSCHLLFMRLLQPTGFSNAVSSCFCHNLGQSKSCCNIGKNKISYIGCKISYIV